MKKSLLVIALLSTLSAAAIAQVTVGDNRNGTIGTTTNNTTNTTTNSGGAATVGAITNGGNTMTGGASNSGGNTLTAGNVSVNTVDPNSLAVAREMSDVKVRNTPSVFTPNLSSSNDTCMGSVTAGGSGPGLGLAFGTTYIDSNCVMLKNSREMWNMGQRDAAMARLCMDADNREALELGGYTCPQTAALAKRQAAAAANTKVEYTDPIVRHRLGLAPILK